MAPQIVLYRGRFGLLDALPNHRPELSRVLVGMHCHRVLHGGLDELVLRVRRDPDGAVHLTRSFAAINVLPGHTPSFPPVGGSSTRWEPLSRPPQAKMAVLAHRKVWKSGLPRDAEPTGMSS